MTVWTTYEKGVCPSVRPSVFMDCKTESVENLNKSVR